MQMTKSRFNLELGDELDKEMSRMASAQSISKAEAVRRALTGYANLRRIVSPDEELILRRRDDNNQTTEQRIIIL